MSGEMLFFLKPDAVARRYVGARVIKTLIDSGITISHIDELEIPREFLAEKHYAEHKGKFFYDWLIGFVSSAPLVVMLLGSENIRKVREMLGSTVVQKADPMTLRGKYGVYGGVNVAHASDSEESADREASLWRGILKVHDGDPRIEAERYIARYIDSPMVDAQRYREVSRAVEVKDIDPDQAKAMFFKLLREESDLEDAILVNLADSLVKNALLKR